MSTFRLLPALAALLLASGCTTLRYDDAPDPTTSSARTLAAAPATVCAAVLATADSMQLRLDAQTRTERGCVLDISRRPPWWLPGDDGERLRVSVAPQGEGSELLVFARRVAPGQVWLHSAAEQLLQASAERALAKRPGI
ncbi:hypothetical protein [Massilia sp. TS11]|uniref:hypothetical protein n=1 Tax=Massilia sp. TS11 TaxID=2908003 RepID=UPI001EDA866C|nr:hypothetical protein [Massilia sp. TS11]MCG2584940.1 hypothetical protein [Massilia sp. TS11]